MHEFSSPENGCSTLISRRPVYVVVDRLAIGSDMRSRLIDSVEICYREGRGEAILEFVPDCRWRRDGAAGFSTSGFECKTCGAPYIRSPKPRLFFVQQPLRGVPSLPKAFGNTVDFDINLVIPDRGKNL